jgi:hypothetical protein
MWKEGNGPSRPNEVSTRRLYMSEDAIAAAPEPETHSRLRPPLPLSRDHDAAARHGAFARRMSSVDADVNGKAKKRET